MTLVDIANGGGSVNEIRSAVNLGSVDKYAIELIRISELYKFELKIKPKKRLKQKNRGKAALTENIVNAKNNIDEELNKAESEEEKEIKQYIAIKEEADSDDVKVAYNNGTAKVKNPGDYKVKESETIRYQELWEKTGFYQEKTYIAKVKVQLWPEHLPYDHLKRKRVFLFC